MRIYTALELGKSLLRHSLRLESIQPSGLNVVGRATVSFTATTSTGETIKVTVEKVRDEASDYGQ